MSILLYQDQYPRSSESTMLGVRLRPQLFTQHVSALTRRRDDELEVVVSQIIRPDRSDFRVP